MPYRKIEVPQSVQEIANIAGMPSVSFDFVDKEYFYPFFKPAFASFPGLTVSRASSKFISVNGVITEFTDDVAAIGDGGLSVEGAATNLYPHSADATQATKFGTGSAGLPTITANAAVAPDGTMTADRVQWDATGGLAGLTFTTPSGSALDINSSIWVRSRLGTVAVFFRAHSGDAAITTVITNDWQRIDDAATSTTNRNPQIYSGAVGTNAIVDLEVWGIQITEGSTALSTYIPTAGSSASRAADIITLTDLDALGLTSAVLAAGYTVVADWVPTTVNSSRVVYGGTLASGNNRAFDVSQTNSGAGISLGVVDGGATTATVSDTGLTAGSLARAAFRIQTNNVGLSIAGRTPVLDTAATIGDMDGIALGRYAPAANLLLNSTFKRLIIIPRAVSDAELQALSAL